MEDLKTWILSFILGYLLMKVYDAYKMLKEINKKLDSLLKQKEVSNESHFS